MEFDIDFKLVSMLTSQEHQRAQEEITTLGMLTAFRQSLQRHDVALDAATDKNTLACKQGCYWCCYFSVDVRAIEIFNIVQFIKEHFSVERLQQIRDELIANSKVLNTLDEVQRMQHNCKCPFLIDGNCSIYSVRPQTCRNYHATDSRGCQQSFEQPNNMDIAPEYAPITFQTGASQVDAFAKAMHNAGYVIDVYELNSAMLEALDHPDRTWQRFIDKKSAFSVTGNDVPLEFMELGE